MPYVPDIKDYKPFYIQTDSDTAAIDTASSFGMVAKSNPYPLLPEPKDVYTNEWKDEDGDDEYIPAEGLKMSAYEMSVKFGMKGDKGTANKNLKAFLDYLRGGTMKLYCDYTKIGRQNVRFVSIGEDATLARDAGGDLLIIKITFKVNDPVTDITLTI